MVIDPFTLRFFFSILLFKSSLAVPVPQPAQAPASLPSRLKASARGLASGVKAGASELFGGNFRKMGKSYSSAYSRTKEYSNDKSINKKDYRDKVKANPSEKETFKDERDRKNLEAKIKNQEVKVQEVGHSEKRKVRAETKLDSLNKELRDRFPSPEEPTAPEPAGKKPNTDEVEDTNTIQKPNTDEVKDTNTMPKPKKKNEPEYKKKNREGQRRHSKRLNPTNPRFDPKENLAMVQTPQMDENNWARVQANTRAEKRKQMIRGDQVMSETQFKEFQSHVEEKGLDRMNFRAFHNPDGSIGIKVRKNAPNPKGAQGAIHSFMVEKMPMTRKQAISKVGILKSKIKYESYFKTVEKGGERYQIEVRNDISNPEAGRALLLASQELSKKSVTGKELHQLVDNLKTEKINYNSYFKTTKDGNGNYQINLLEGAFKDKRSSNKKGSFVNPDKDSTNAPIPTKDTESQNSPEVIPDANVVETRESVN